MDQDDEEGRRDGTCEAFAITGERGEFLGVGIAVHIDRPGRTVELGYVVARAARGAGVASRALGLLTDWAFAEVGALRIELRIAASNEASKRVAARASYRYEGTLRSLHLERTCATTPKIWSRFSSTTPWRSRRQLRRPWCSSSSQSELHARTAVRLAAVALVRVDGLPAGVLDECG